MATARSFDIPKRKCVLAVVTPARWLSQRFVDKALADLRAHFTLVEVSRPSDLDALRGLGGARKGFIYLDGSEDLRDEVHSRLSILGLMELNENEVRSFVAPSRKTFLWALRLAKTGHFLPTLPEPGATVPVPNEATMPRLYKRKATAEEALQEWSKLPLNGPAEVVRMALIVDEE